MLAHSVLQGRHGLQCGEADDAFQEAIETQYFKAQPDHEVAVRIHFVAGVGLHGLHIFTLLQ